jgi:Holliday junction resolvase
MASTPEGKVKKAVKKILDAEGVYYFFPATGGYGRSGIPDIVCCVQGYFLAIECKAAHGGLTALQTHELAKITRVGGHTFVATPATLDALPFYLKTLKQRKT